MEYTHELDKTKAEIESIKSDMELSLGQMTALIDVLEPKERYTIKLWS